MAHVKRIKAGTSAQRGAWTPGGSGELFLDTDLLTAGAATALFAGGATLPAGGTQVAPGTSLSTVAGAAPAAAGAVGTSTDAARGDHVHPFQSAANTPSTAVGNLAATNVDAALAELQGDVDNLTTLTANDFLSGTGAPAAALGQDGYGYLNRANGDIYEKAASAWTLTGDNAYAQLGLSAVAGSAPTAAGAAGTATVAARGDHSHPFQSAADTSVTAITNLTATDVQAALAELQGDVDTLNTNTAGLTAGTAAAVAANTAAIATLSTDSHTHANKIWLDALTAPLAADNGKVFQATGANTGAWTTPTAAPVTSIFGLTGAVAITDLTVVTTHAGATDLVILQTAAGPRAITIDNLMNAN